MRSSMAGPPPSEQHHRTIELNERAKKKKGSKWAEYEIRRMNRAVIPVSNGDTPKEVVTSGCVATT